MAQHQPGNDDDGLGALDFSFDDNRSEDSDALGFYGPDDAADAATALDDLPEYAPAESGNVTADLEAIDAAAEVAEESDEEDALPLFTVTNPPETVSVSANMDGSIQRVELSGKVTTMTEAELAAEILVIADLARQKGLAGQHEFVLEQANNIDIMRELGADDPEGLSRFLAMPEGANLPTRQQAIAAEAEVFATRYTAGG